MNSASGLSKSMQLIAVLGLLALGACGDDGANQDGDDTGTPSPTGDTTGSSTETTGTTDTGDTTGPSDTGATETTGTDIGTDSGTGTTGDTTDETTGPTELTECPEPAASDDIQKTPGKLADGRVILPNGFAIKPIGTTIKSPVWATVGLLTPDGKHYIVGGNGDAPHALQVIDTATWTETDSVEVSKVGDRLFVGLAYDATKRRLYAAGGQTNKIVRYTLSEAGKLTRSDEVAAPGFPAGLFLTANGQSLYVAANTGKELQKYDVAGDTMSLSGPGLDAGELPYGVYVTPDEKTAFVSNWGSEEFTPDAVDPSVTVLDLTDRAAKPKELDVGKNPEVLVPSRDGKTLYVVSTDGDQINLIDIATATVRDTITLGKDNPYGVGYAVGPTYLAESLDGATLYVGSQTRNTIEVVDVASKSVKGSISTAWWPTHVAVSPDGKTLYWLAARGEGSGANADGRYIGGMLDGMAGKLAVPDAATLQTYTGEVAVNLGRRTAWAASCKPRSPVLPVPGSDTPSVIKHVILVVKENQTYDAYFGDLEKGNGEPSLNLWPEAISPNHHALARRFVNLDNFYSETEISSQGHLWLTTMANNSYHEKVWTVNYKDGSSGRLPKTGVEEASFPTTGVWLGHVLDSGLTPRNYGEITGAGSNPPRFFEYTNLKYGFYNLTNPDTQKVRVFIDDLEQGILKDFTYLTLPLDHTYGTNPGRPTPEWMVMDNDYALGQLVEAVSKSPFWNETVILVTEDDPQYAADHVDAHRTIGLVISPWSRREYLSSVQYSFMSFFRTLEQMLGMPPLTIYDATAMLMSDVFDSAMNNGEPYTALKPSAWTAEPQINPDTPAARALAQPDGAFDWPDMTPELGRILMDRHHAAQTAQTVQKAPPVGTGRSAGLR
jgi:YVTN family beta-propeller protein